MTFELFWVAFEIGYISPYIHTILHCHGEASPAYQVSINIIPGEKKWPDRWRKKLVLWLFNAHFHLYMIGLGTIHFLQWYLTCLPLTQGSSLSLWLPKVNHIKYNKISLSWVQQKHMYSTRVYFHHRNTLIKQGLVTPQSQKPYQLSTHSN